ncbi:hypothetical protein CSPX01_16256 [Colletotrichum filicis]|nr:hypothetical protein CSPX01_16256 [Colletotrichum filicis]
MRFFSLPARRRRHSEDAIIHPNTTSSLSLLLRYQKQPCFTLTVIDSILGSKFYHMNSRPRCVSSACVQQTINSGPGHIHS